jgi:hypothetical protein
MKLITSLSLIKEGKFLLNYVVICKTNDHVINLDEFLGFDRKLQGMKNSLVNPNENWHNIT